jgi:hypothetical protein
LGNLVVLAKLTTEIAPEKSKREGFLPRQQVVHRFFLNRIYTTGDQIPPPEGNEFPIPIFPYATQTSLSG